jgi:hypothetical protein
VSASVGGTPLFETAAFVGRDLYSDRDEEKYLGGNFLHAPVHGVANPAREVDESPGQFSIDVLEVHDHRNDRLELIGQLLGVAEGARCQYPGRDEPNLRFSGHRLGARRDWRRRPVLSGRHSTKWSRVIDLVAGVDIVVWLDLIDGIE